MDDTNLIWTCPCCGQQFDHLPFDYAFSEPDAWNAVPLAERGHRGVLGTDTCTLDGRHFIRGRIVIPVTGHRDFTWGAWVQVSGATFARFGELWDVEIREHEPRMPGLLANDIKRIYPPTLDLRCSLLMQNARQRPNVVIESVDHPLAADQREGINLDRVTRIAAAVFEH